MRKGPLTVLTCVLVSSVPVTSTPPNASHRLRLWIRTPVATVSSSSSVISHEQQSYIYQRLWKSDNFKLGSELNFETLSSKLVMGVRDARGPQVQMISRETSTAAKTPRIVDDEKTSSYYDRRGTAL